ncbi:hypothetical protein [Flindersiella endophytica]
MLGLVMALVLAFPVPFGPAVSAVSATSAPGGGGHECSAPPLPPTGSPLVIDPASAAAPAGASRPASSREAREVRAGLDNFVTCINAGDHLRASTLFTAYFVRAGMGQSSYERVPAVLAGLRMEHVRIDRILAYEDSSFVTEARYLAYGHQLVHARTTWWPEDGFLKVDGMETLQPDLPAGAAEINVDMGEYFYRLDRQHVCPRNGKLVLHLRNVGAEFHEANLLRLPPGAEPEDIFDGTITQDQVETIAQGGNGGDVAMVRVEPGTYTLVDFIPAPDGRPHGAHGMTAQLRVC